MSDRPTSTPYAFPPAAAWWTDAAGEFLAFSPRWQTWTGREVDKELGKGWLESVHPEDVPLWERSCGPACDSEGEFRCDLRLRTGTRWMWVRMHGLPRHDAADRFVGFTGSATDVSDLKCSIDEVNQLLQAVLHDLRAPVRNLAQILGDLAAGEPGSQSLARARVLTDSLEELLRDLVEYTAAGTRAPRAQSVDPAESLAWARANLAPLIERTRAEITVGPLPRVLADPIHVGRVFQNLLVNALQYCGAAPPRVQISGSRKAAEVRFAVRDHGIGIPADAHEAIFRAFERLSGADTPGSGLGLAICRKLVELHGGRIWVESRPGSGATFHFTLSAADSSE